ncbi:MAG: carboxypeptidase regulatory-like domain-containing protein [Saccharothrix sp.]|nr:carboxypeptidase regulatory-like domain-containing protein [Saccharothrix sp.]
MNDTAHLTLTLTNNGPAPITGVEAECSSKASVWFHLGELTRRGPAPSVGLLTSPGTSGCPTGPPVPNVKVYLTDQFTGAVIARARTDASGRFEFSDVPAGAHKVGVVGSWWLVDGDRFEVHPGAEPTRSHQVRVWQRNPRHSRVIRPRPRRSVGLAVGTRRRLA